MNKENKNKKSRLVKWLKPFSIGGVHPLRIINPFTWKRFNLEKLYNTIYLFNKITKSDFKPIPYSKKLTEIEKKMNKEMVESIIYELRILFGSYCAITFIYMYWLITSDLKIGIFHTCIITIIFIIFIAIIRISIKLLKSSKNNCLLNENSPDLVDQYIYQEPICDIFNKDIPCEQPISDIKSIINKVRARKKIRKILDTYNNYFNKDGKK